MSEVQQGIHLIERRALGGLKVPEPFLGVLDVVRTIEGRLPEPASDQPLGVIGLDRLLEVTGDEAPAVMSHLRRSFHEGRSYFEWSRIPLVLLVEGELGPHHLGGPELHRGSAHWPLAPLVGKRLEPVDGNERWWWSPQIV